jgi:hypothetical protein
MRDGDPDTSKTGAVRRHEESEVQRSEADSGLPPAEATSQIMGVDLRQLLRRHSTCHH